MTVTHRKSKLATDQADHEPGTRYHCDVCGADITLTVRVQCAGGCNEFDLCGTCFCSGAEVGAHKAWHAYRVIERNSFPIFTDEWGADEELLLIDGCRIFGLGNWADIADHIGNRTAEEVERHYVSVYLEGEDGTEEGHQRARAEEARLARERAAQRSAPLPPEEQRWEQPPIVGPNMHFVPGVTAEEFQRRKRARINTLRKTQQALVSQHASQLKNAKPLVSAPTSHHEIAGFMAGRLEFDVEYEQDAENLNKDMEFGRVYRFGGDQIKTVAEALGEGQQSVQGKARMPPSARGNAASRTNTGGNPERAAKGNKGTKQDEADTADASDAPDAAEAAEAADAPDAPDALDAPDAPDAPDIPDNFDGQDTDHATAMADLIDAGDEDETTAAASLPPGGDLDEAVEEANPSTDQPSRLVPDLDGDPDAMDLGDETQQVEAETQAASAAARPPPLDSTVTSTTVSALGDESASTPAPADGSAPNKPPKPSGQPPAANNSAGGGSADEEKPGDWDEDDADLLLKLTILDMYGDRLNRREKRKKFLLERNLVNYRRNLAAERRRPKEERDLLHRIRHFAQLQSGQDFEDFYNGLCYEDALRRQAVQLQRWRRAGITTIAEGLQYEQESNDRTKRAAAIAEGGLAALPHLAHVASLGSPSPTSTGSVRTGSPAAGSKGRESSVSLTASATAPDPLAASAGSSGRNKAAGLGAAGAGRTISRPLDLSSDPNLGLLSDAEQRLCSEQRIRPATYLTVKRSILVEQRRRGGKLERRDLRAMFKLDPARLAKVYDVLETQGLVSSPDSSLRSGDSRLAASVIKPGVSGAGTGTGTGAGSGSGSGTGFDSGSAMDAGNGVETTLHSLSSTASSHTNGHLNGSGLNGVR